MYHEETGWTLKNIRLIGFLHYRHKNPKPPEYRYPYPDFIQLVYVANADTFQPESLASEYEVHGLRTIAE